MRQLNYRLLIARCRSCIAYQKRECPGSRSVSELPCGR